MLFVVKVRIGLVTALVVCSCAPSGGVALPGTSGASRSAPATSGEGGAYQRINGVEGSRGTVLISVSGPDRAFRIVVGNKPEDMAGFAVTVKPGSGSATVLFANFVIVGGGFENVVLPDSAALPRTWQRWMQRACHGLAPFTIAARRAGVSGTTGRYEFSQFRAFTGCLAVTWAAGSHPNRLVFAPTGTPHRHGVATLWSGTLPTP
jgi:hypothetical protein